MSLFDLPYDEFLRHVRGQDRLYALHQDWPVAPENITFGVMNFDFPRASFLCTPSISLDEVEKPEENQPLDKPNPNLPKYSPQ